MNVTDVENQAGTFDNSKFFPSRDRERGKELRKAVPRALHSAWQSTERPDPIDTLKSTTVDRVPHLNPIRFGRMLESPLAYLRGAPLVMAHDLAATPRTGITVQACGDAHLLNFGLFASTERNLLFDLNDFDETLVGPWEWDLKRLATSLAVAARQFGLCGDHCDDCVRACVRSYRTHVYEYSMMSLLAVWYSRVDGKTLFKVFPGKRNSRLADTLDKAHRHDHREAVHKLTHDDDGCLRFKDNPPVIAHAANILSRDELENILESYRNSLQDDRRHLFDGYKLIDYALKVVGVGSVGTRCFAALFGSDQKKDCIVLQIKEATPSVLEGPYGKAWHGNQGQRTVVGQRLIQGFSDIFLGWGSDGQRDYYVRQLRDMKAQLDPAKSSNEELCSYAELCGWVLARAHSRSGNAAIISGYLGKGDSLDTAVGKFANRYADQTEKDFAAFQVAVHDGRLQAETGV